MTFIFELDDLFVRLLSILLFSLLGSVGLFLDDSLNDLLFFDQESSNDSFLDGVSRLGTTVGSGNGLLGSRDSGVLSWSQSRDTLQWNTGVTTLWSGSQLLDVLTTQSTTWGLNDLNLVRLGVVCDDNYVKLLVILVSVFHVIRLGIAEMSRLIGEVGVSWNYRTRTSYYISA